MFYRTAPVGERSLSQLEEICCQRLLKLHTSFRSARRASAARADDAQESGSCQASDEEEEDGEDQNDNGRDVGQVRRGLLAATMASSGRSRRPRDHQTLTASSSNDDVIGHFTLRLALCGKFSCWKAWVYAEASLFSDRMSGMSTDEVSELVWSNREHEPALSLLPDDRAAIFLTAWRYANRDDRAGFATPFQCVPELVATRSVEVCGGEARVRCSYLGQLLQNAFFDGVWKTRAWCQRAHVQAAGDHRLQGLFSRLQDIARRCLVGGSRSGGSGGAAREPVHPSLVDGLSSFFPPCMRHMHRTLRRQHRLDHHARIQYSLYLKRIGLGAEDALQFWREEYSKKPTCCHGLAGCSHSWQSDGRRYTYNIRHLYGMEGSRRNYPCYSCQHMIDESGSATGAGGCPFRYFDRAHLSEVLHLYDVDNADIASILDRQSSGAEKTLCSDLLRLAWRKHRSTHGTIDSTTECNAGHGNNTALCRRSTAACQDTGCGGDTERCQLGEAVCGAQDNGRHSPRGSRPPNELLLLAVDTDSEDDDSFLSRLSDLRAAPSEMRGAPAAAASSSHREKPSSSCSRTSSPAAGVHPGCGTASSAPNPSCAAFLEDVRSPVDFFETFRNLLDSCAGCRGLPH